MHKPAILSASEQKETELALVLHKQLAAINPLEIEVLTRDRHIARKDQAKLARGLFRKLGLKGISVRVPTYSMAHVVEVRMPGRRDYLLDERLTLVPGCEASVANTAAHKRMGALLLSAFPNHDDRSDMHTDSADYRWSVS